MIERREIFGDEKGAVEGQYENRCAEQDPRRFDRERRQDGQRAIIWGVANPVSDIAHIGKMLGCPKRMESALLGQHADLDQIADIDNPPVVGKR